MVQLVDGKRLLGWVFFEHGLYGTICVFVFCFFLCVVFGVVIFEINLLNA